MTRSVVDDDDDETAEGVFAAAPFCSFAFAMERLLACFASLAWPRRCGQAGQVASPRIDPRMQEKPGFLILLTGIFKLFLIGVS